MPYVSRDVALYLQDIATCAAKVIAHTQGMVEDVETLMRLEGTDATHTPFYVSALESGKVKHILLEEGDFTEE